MHIEGGVFYDSKLHPQHFLRYCTIKASPGLSGPANMWDKNPNKDDYWDFGPSSPEEVPRFFLNVYNVHLPFTDRNAGKMLSP